MTKSEIRSMTKREILLNIRGRLQKTLDKIVEALTTVHYWNATHPDAKPLTADDDASVAKLVERKKQTVESLTDIDRQIAELPDMRIHNEN